jgi:cell wall assembly regulator SMI1
MKVHRERAQQSLEEMMLRGLAELKHRATEEELRDFEARNGVALPADLRGWLKVCSGAELVVREFLGVGLSAEYDYLDIEGVLDVFPKWRERRWIPVGTDACGNYYVIDVSDSGMGSHPVYFIDQENYDKFCYVMASGIWPFVWFVLRIESAFEEDHEGDFHWPFDREKVLEEDPELRNFRGPAPFPWEEDSL